MKSLFIGLLLLLTPVAFGQNDSPEFVSINPTSIRRKSGVLMGNVLPSPDVIFTVEGSLANVELDKPFVCMLNKIDNTLNCGDFKLTTNDAMLYGFDEEDAKVGID